ncbi:MULTISPECIES: hypothetical protein [unclassified Nocardioides]
MSDNSMANGLVQTWVPVIDSDGRTHLEARWIDSTSTPTHVSHAA